MASGAPSFPVSESPDVGSADELLGGLQGEMWLLPGVFTWSFYLELGFLPGVMVVVLGFLTRKDAALVAVLWSFWLSWAFPHSRFPLERGPLTKRQAHTQKERFWTKAQESKDHQNSREATRDELHSCTGHQKPQTNSVYTRASKTHPLFRFALGNNEGKHVQSHIPIEPGEIKKHINSANGSVQQIWKRHGGPGTLSNFSMSTRRSIVDRGFSVNP